MAGSRGRPKSKARLISEELDLAFKDRPSYIPKPTKKASRKMLVSYELGKRDQKKLISSFSTILPERLVSEVAFIGDETMQGFEAPILEEFKTRMASEKSGQLEGARATLQKAKNRANTVWGKNQDLANRIGRNHTIHSASEKILNEWDSRGDGPKRPSLRTIKNWYQTFISK